MSRALGCVLLALLEAGCAAHRAPDTDVASAASSGSAGPSSLSSVPGEEGLSPSSTTGSVAEAKTRSLEQTTSELVEETDRDLKAVLRTAATEPSAENERRVADAYRKAGILDLSYEHFSQAIRLDPRDGWAYEGRARIWRDWGFPAQGLGDAHRAAYFLHDAPEALNTLGTLLYAQGQRSEARQFFERALRKEPDAVYALNNLCYAALMDGDIGGARTVCERAVAIEPRSTAARNNLALVTMAEGDVAGATRAFAESASPAALQYNLGLVYLGSGRYAEAAAAFENAVRLNPTLPFVDERLKQARLLAGGKDARR